VGLNTSIKFTNLHEVVRFDEGFINSNGAFNELFITHAKGYNEVNDSAQKNKKKKIKINFS
jgi:hypothetical protein